MVFTLFSTEEQKVDASPVAANTAAQRAATRWYSTEFAANSAVDIGYWQNAGYISLNLMNTGAVYFAISYASLGTAGANAVLFMNSGGYMTGNASKLSFDAHRQPDGQPGVEEKVRKFRVFAPATYVSVDFAAREAQVYRFEPGPAGPTIAVERSASPDDEPLRRQLASFVEAVRGGLVPRVTGLDGRRALALALTILERIQAGPGR